MTDRVYVYDSAIEPTLLAEAVEQILSVPRDQWDVYRHPFEPKLQLPKQHYRTGPLLNVLSRLHRPGMREAISHDFWLPEPEGDRDGYYTAVYLYRPGDYLQRHLDSAVHGKRRKVVTANLYLTACEGGELRIGPFEGPQSIITPAPNTLALFVNDDRAYHEVTRVTSGERLIITTGYTLPVRLFPRDGFTLTNERALFVPGYGERWTKEQYAMAEERAGGMS